MRKQKKCLCLAGLLLAALFLSCCGDRTREQPTADSFVYSVVKTMEGSEAKTAGGHLYYIRYDASGNEGRNQLVKVAGTENIQDSSVVFESEKGLKSFAVGGDGSVYCLTMESELVSGQGRYEIVLTGAELVKVLPDGREGYRLGLDEIKDYAVSMAADDKGQVFLLCGHEIFRIDKEGKTAGKLAIEDYCTLSQYGKEAILEGPGNKIYCYVDNNVRSLYKVAEKGASLELAPVEGISWPGNFGAGGGAFGSAEGILYNSRSDGVLYQYDEEQNAWQGLLRWGDSGISGGSVQKAVRISAESIAVEMSDGTISILSVNPLDETPEKERLVLATTGILSYDLEKYVAEFNKNSAFLVTIEAYDRTEEGLARLDARLLSSDPPDLLDLSGLDVQKYAGKGALENLAPFLQNSSVLSAEDFLDNALEGYTIDGKLVAIPDSFEVNVLAGRAGQLGPGGGWTMEEAYAFADSYPDHRIFVFMGFEFVYDICREYVLEEYVDWETGECSFDSQGFCRLAEWLAGRTKGIETEYDREYDTTEGVLLYKHRLSNCRSMVWPETIFGSETIIRAYPSAAGDENYKAGVYDALGILSVSPRKEKAWEFMEGFLSRMPGEGNFYYTYCFPCRRELLEKEIAYYREGGAYGKQMENASEDKDVWMGLDREQEEELRGILTAADFTPDGGLKGQVTNIVKEELAYYLTGQKSLEEVVSVLQNRVRNLLQENLAD